MKNDFLFLLQTLLLGQLITHQMDSNTIECIANDALLIDEKCFPSGEELRALVWSFVNYRIGKNSKPGWLVFTTQPVVILN